MLKKNYKPKGKYIVLNQDDFELSEDGVHYKFTKDSLERQYKAYKEGIKLIQNYNVTT